MTSHSGGCHRGAVQLDVEADADAEGAVALMEAENVVDTEEDIDTDADEKKVVDKEGELENVVDSDTEEEKVVDSDLELEDVGDDEAIHRTRRVKRRMNGQL